MGKLLNALLPAAETFVRKRAKEYVPTVENNLVSSSLNVISTFFTKFVEVDGEYEVPPELALALPSLIEKMVLFGVVWGSGASCDTASRLRFDTFLRGELETLGAAEVVALPAEGLVYDYAIDLESNTWVGWMSTIPEFTLSPK
eukprot:520208-Pleurochrysis_carterae.AAC.2